MALCRQVPDLSKWIASLGSGLAGADPSLIGAEQVIMIHQLWPDNKLNEARFSVYNHQRPLQS